MPRDLMPRNPQLTRRSFLQALLASAALVGCSDGSVSAPAQSDAPSREIVYDREGPDELSILMIGDILVHQGVWQSGERSDGTRNYEHLFAQIAGDVAAADVAIVGQETILGGTALGLSGYPTFNSPQEIGDAEVAVGFDVALCASNHACDKGEAGINAALSYWRSTHPDMLVTGLADSQEAFDALPIIERAGHKIAVLNYTYGTNGIPMPHSYSVRMLDEAQIRADAEAVRAAGAQAIVACPHWGVEYAAAPSDEQRAWAQLLADVGADVIIGGHPHVMQPFEVIESSEGRAVPVFWSVGNFTSTQPFKETMVGAMARATLSFDGSDTRCEVVSCNVTPLITHRAPTTSFTTYKIADYTEELAAANQIRGVSGCADFTHQWCVDFCAGRLGEAFDAGAGKLVWEA